MIRFIHGNLFDSKASALVNTVNCVGVMGKGVAYQFRRAYPAVYADYIKKCKSNDVQLGSLTTFEENGRLVINFPTKGHWKTDSRLQDIRAGLTALRALLVTKAIRSIAMPPLGCGNGGLNWKDVKALLLELLSDLDDIDIEIYEPAATFESEVAQAARMSLSHFVVTALRIRLNSSKKLDIQKAAYFFNVFHKERYFRFVAHKFGPFCPDIDRLLLGIKDALDHSRLTPEQLIEDGTKQRLRGTEADRFLGMARAVELATNLCNEEAAHVEALATAHAVVEQHAPIGMDRLIEEFLAWSPEKGARFTGTDVKHAVQKLESRGLICRTLLGFELTHVFHTHSSAPRTRNTSRLKPHS